MNGPETIPLVVLFGGGVESVTLVRRFLAEGQTVLPLHQHWGLLWDDAERAWARRFCRAHACDLLLPLLEVRCSPDAVAGCWAVTGVQVPQAGDPAEGLEIPVRNLTLLTNAAAHLTHLGRLDLVMGTTGDNRFSDGTREFFDRCEQTLSRDFRKPVRVLTPLLGADKTQVIRQSDPDTLALSFSCLSPRGETHCGACYKCGRRQAAFRQAGVIDPTVYAHPSSPPPLSNHGATR